MTKVTYDGLVYQSEIEYIIETRLSARLDYHERVLEAAAKELKLFYVLLASTTDELRDKFTEAERSYLVGITSSSRLDEFVAVKMFHASIVDAEPAYDEMWAVNGQELGEKVKNLSLVERYALVDAIKQYWIRVSKGEQPSVVDLFDLDPESLKTARVNYIHVQV